MKKLNIINVVGARPNFMKMAPIIKAMKASGKISPYLVHTGQHYDEKMSKLFFTDLKIPKPNIYLGVGSGSHSVQTSKIMTQFEEICQKKKPDFVLVVGDVNSTLACSIVAAKMCIPVIHVEAGLRSGDWTMPEEINRIVTDSLTSLFLTPSMDANEILLNEGKKKSQIKFVGNVMIDSLLDNLKKSSNSKIRKQLGILDKAYGLITLHRPANVDVKKTFTGILSALMEISKDLDLIFPIHPRTRARIKQFGFEKKLEKFPNLKFIDPQGYLDFLSLTSNAKIVLTDSGGIQEETTVLGIPCLTLRENTERPITVSEGTNKVIGMNRERIIKEAKAILSGKQNIPKRKPKYWDGKTSERIVRSILNYRSP